MRTKTVKGDKLETGHIILAIKTAMGWAIFPKPQRVWEVIDSRESNSWGIWLQTYHVGPMDGNTAKQLLSWTQFTGYSDTEYQVLDIY